MQKPLNAEILWQDETANQQRDIFYLGTICCEQTAGINVKTISIGSVTQASAREERTERQSVTISGSEVQAARTERTLQL